MQGNDNWTLVTNHTAVLCYIAEQPYATVREIARDVSLSQRRVVDILKDLSDSGTVAITKMGRRNAYSVQRDAPFRLPIESQVKIGDFLDLIAQAKRNRSRARDTGVLGLTLLGGLTASSLIGESAAMLGGVVGFFGASFS